MTPSQDLIKEHGSIKLMLVIVGRIKERIEKGENVEPAKLKKIVEFFQIFADACHHGKEEKLFFPAVLQVGSDEDRILVTELIEEHKQSREYIKAIAKGENIAQNFGKYIELLTQHIRKEDFQLFPSADKKLTKLKQKELEEKFNIVEEEVIGSGKHEEFISLLAQLRKIYL